MIDQDKIIEIKATLDAAASKLDKKGLRKNGVDTLNKILNRIDDLNDMNKGEVNKFIMLLEYTVNSLRDSEFKVSQKRFKQLHSHLNKSFGVYLEGETITLAIGIGMAMGVSLGVAYGAVISNVSTGIALGISFGLSIGAAIGVIRERKLKEQGKIL